MPSAQSWQHYWGNYVDLRRYFLPWNIRSYSDCTKQALAACALISSSTYYCCSGAPQWSRGLTTRFGSQTALGQAVLQGWSPNARVALRPAGPDLRALAQLLALRISHTWYPEAATQGKSYSPLLTSIPNYSPQSALSAWAASPPGQHNYLIATAGCEN